MSSITKVEGTQRTIDLNTISDVGKSTIPAVNSAIKAEESQGAIQSTTTSVKDKQIGSLLNFTTKSAARVEAPRRRSCGRVHKWRPEETDLLTEFYNSKLMEEKSDPSKVTTWKDLDQQISSFLESKGYDRSWRACGLQWQKIQKAQGLDTPAEVSEDGVTVGSPNADSIPPEEIKIKKEEDEELVQEGFTIFQHRKPYTPWSDSEQQILADLVKEQIQLEACAADEKVLTDTQF